MQIRRRETKVSGRASAELLQFVLCVSLIANRQIACARTDVVVHVANNRPDSWPHNYLSLSLPLPHSGLSIDRQSGAILLAVCLFQRTTQYDLHLIDCTATSLVLEGTDQGTAKCFN